MVPIALVDEHNASVFLMPHGQVYDKVMSNLQEIKARGGPVIAVVMRGRYRGDEVGRRRHRDSRGGGIPAADHHGDPLQLLAYHIAVARGCDVDKPRNLARA